MEQEWRQVCSSRVLPASPNTSIYSTVKVTGPAETVTPPGMNKMFTPHLTSMPRTNGWVGYGNADPTMTTPKFPPHSPILIEFHSKEGTVQTGHETVQHHLFCPTVSPPQSWVSWAGWLSSSDCWATVWETRVPILTFLTFCWMIQCFCPQPLPQLHDKVAQCNMSEN